LLQRPHRLQRPVGARRPAGRESLRATGGEHGSWSCLNPAPVPGCGTSARRRDPGGTGVHPAAPSPGAVSARRCTCTSASGWTWQNHPMDFAWGGAIAIVTIVLVARFSTKLGVAAPLVLVLVGVIFSLVPGTPSIELEPEWILVGVLPPLLYSAAVTVPIIDLRRNLKAISSLSVVLVIVSTAVSGFVLYLVFPNLELAPAFALGAVISPPDAVAATAVGKRLGLPPRLVSVLEGEGRVNDATALVLLRTAIGATAATVTFWNVLGDFVLAVLAAVVIGLVIGYLAVEVRSRLNNPVLTTAVSFAVPFIAYLPAEQLHASGVLSVVIAGLVTGHRGAKLLTAQDRISERLNWRTIQFVLENGVFLLLGVELKPLVEAVQEDRLGVGSA